MTDKKLKDSNSLERRDFFKQIILASVAINMPTLFLGCADNPDAFVGKGRAPFKVWEEMVNAVMSSPDYLPGRVETLIKEGDLKKMYHFVKDEIILIPPNERSLYGLGDKTKWGIQGALRCGMATPREKAELLNQMYMRVGVKSEVVYEKTSIDVDKAKSIFIKPVSREFEPKISKKQLRIWRNEMGVSKTVDQTKEVRKDYRNESEQLTNKLLNYLDVDERKIHSFDFRWDNNRTPTLKFYQDGKEKFAHLFDPNVSFGELQKPTNKTSKPGSIKHNEEQISLSIKCRKSTLEKEDIELVSGKWKATDLIGKQLAIQFLHGLIKEEQMVTVINQLRTFTPAIALQGTDVDLKTLEDNSFIGDPFTLEGDKIHLTNDTSKNLISHRSKFVNKPRPNYQRQVHSISILPTATNFPKVKLMIDVKDKGGNVLEGLSPSDFNITEDGIPVKAIMENNQKTPKILVLSDISGSMPKEYLGERMNSFNEQIETEILKKFPASILTFWETPSTLFTWLLKASRTDYDLIVFATDGDNSDSYNDKNKSIYNSGPPALILNVKNSSFIGHTSTFSKMAELTGGKVFNAKNQKNVITEIISFIDTIDPAPYAFSYGSSDKEKLHVVKVSIDKGRVENKSTYLFPKSENTETNAIVGIYLELKIGKKPLIRRVLAGWDTLYPFDSNKSEMYAHSVKELLIGGTILSIEGEGPTLAMAIKDLLTAKLSHRNWGELYMDNKIKEAQEELDKGVIIYPSELIPLLAPLQDQATNKSLTFPTGYRIGLVKTTIGIDNRPTVQSFDYLPTSNYKTITVNDKESFAINLEKSSQLAIRESSLYKNSTSSLLGNKELIFHKKNDKEWLKSIGIDYKHPEYRFWSERILRGSNFYKINDKNATTKAYWQINKATGELYGIMPDGSGGGKSPFDSDIKGSENVIGLLMSILNIINHIGSMFGVTAISTTGAISLGVVAKYGVTLVKLYAIVSETILVMDASGMNDKIKKELQTLACQVFKEVTYGVGGKPGATMAGLETIIGEIIDKENKGRKDKIKNPFKCP